MPALFIGHGNPMNAIEGNSFHRSWAALGRRLPVPAGILCVSAHWETRGIGVTAADHPATIHDFRGFPQALFDVRYPAPGDPALARRVCGLLAAEGAQPDAARGLDHGAWSVLAPMYPAADIPVVQLSLDTSEPGAFHYRLGRALAPLRDEGILVIGSGNIVHNLALFDFADPDPAPWALAFDEMVRERLRAGDHAALVAWDTLGPAARRAIPTPEHYLPLLYVLGLQQEGELLVLFNDTVLSALSMTSVIIGGPG